MDKLMSALDVAEYLGVCRQQVYQWARERQLPYYRLGCERKAEYRFSESDVRKWLESNRSNANK